MHFTACLTTPVEVIAYSIASVMFTILLDFKYTFLLLFFFDNTFESIFDMFHDRFDIFVDDTFNRMFCQRF